MNGTKTLLCTAALAALTLVSSAHAQIAFRSSSSAFIAGGGGTPVAPTLRSSSSAVLKTGPTRFYVLNIGPDVDPTVRGTWPQDNTPGITRAFLRAMQSGSNLSAASTATGAANPGHYLVNKWVSEPLPTAQAISGTLNWVFGAGETNAGLNAYTKLHVYVLREPDTVVGKLLDNYAESATSSPAGTEWGTTQVGRGPAGGTAKPLSLVNAQAGDRIVIEAGYIAYSTRTDTGRIDYSSSSTVDMAVGGSGISWFEFSQDLFGSTIRKPQGTVAGDVMIVSISVRPNTATITPPAGWTPMQRINNPTAPTASLAMYRRTADASDSAVYAYPWSISGATSAIGAIRSFSGVDTTTPVDVENGQSTVGTNGTHATPDVTTTLVNTMLVATFATAGGSLNWAIVPTGMTENFDVATAGTGTGTTMAGDTVVQATAGATGTKQAVVSNNTAYPGTTHILALRGIGAGGSSTLTINKPAGVAQNDIMIASINVGPSTATITPPAGWALVRRMDNTNGTSNSLAVYKLLAGAAEPASYTWTLSSGHTGAAGGIQAFSGADPAIDAENGQTTASGTSHATPSVNTTYSNTMIITSHGVGATSTWTQPAGMNETADAQGGSQALEMNWVLQAAPASNITKTATSSAAGTGNTHILALRRVLGNFNAFETSTPAGATGGVIKTKVAGSTVSLATISKNAANNAVATTFVGTVKVEVLDASNNSAAPDANGCRSTWTPIPVVIPDITFAAADNGRKNISFSVPDSYRDVRLRMTSPPGGGANAITGCSSDNFAIRPNQFLNVLVTDTDSLTAGTGRALTNNNATGGNVHKAGRPFTVRATAVNSDDTTTSTNYAGTPTATPSQCGAGTACFATVGTLTVGGSFVAGVLNSTAASYSEAGSFALTLVDDTFANVDAADGSTTTERNITSSALTVGRFVPDRFEFATPSTPRLLTFGTASCGSRSFTYIGQPFWYASAQSPSATLNAVNAAGAVTTNYAVTGSKPSISETYSDGSAPAAAPLNSASKGTPTLSAGAGTGAYSAASGGLLSYTRGTTSSALVAPFSAAISLSVTASDATEAGVTGNGTITTPTALVFNGGGTGIAFDGSNFNTLAGLTGGKTLVYGRLRLGNANGSQLVALPVRAEAQYWASSALGFVTNTADSCTTLANNNVQMSSFTGANFSACKTAITTPVITLSSGRGLLLLTPPGNANSGTVLLTANLSAAASPQACTAVNGGTPIVPAAGADKAYLQGNWAGSNYVDNPSARAAFGTFKGAEEVIFVRERTSN
jgi:hypothetical protein